MICGMRERSLLGDVEDERSLFWDVGMRSLLGCGGAIVFWDVRGRAIA